MIRKNLYDNSCHSSLLPESYDTKMLMVCYNSQGGRNSAILDSAQCTLGNWSSWSSCSKTCPSFRTRSRNFVYKKHRKVCSSHPNGPELQQTDECLDVDCEGKDEQQVSETTSQTEANDNEQEDYDGGEVMGYEGDESSAEVASKRPQVQNL